MDINQLQQQYFLLSMTNLFLKWKVWETLLPWSDAAFPEVK